MYAVETDTDQRQIFTRRRDAFQAARKAARVHGWATWIDLFHLEPSIAFRCERGRAVICRCTAETRLIRAIFDDAHPDKCIP